MPEDTLSGEFVLNNSSEKDNKTSTTIKTDKIIQKNPVNFLTSLKIHPKGVFFENQEEDEEIILLIRRDLITNVPWIITAILLALLPLVLFFLSGLFSPFFQISGPTLVVAILFYYLIIIGFIIVEFTLWYFNVGLITNKRVVDLDVSGILFKHVSETKLDLIEDVSYTQVGSIRSIFNYGDVHIQTAGSFANFEFDRAPEPARIVRIIADMIGGK